MMLSTAAPRIVAAIKLFAALAMVVSVALWPVRLAWFLLVPAGVLLVLGLISGAGIGRLLWKLLRLEPLALGVTVFAVFQPDGFRVAGLLLARSTLCLATMVLLSATTPFPDILGVLRAMRMPRLLLATLSLMSRYLHVLVDESHRMRRARLSRTFTRRPSWRALASIIGLLFVRSAERAERIHHAMVARGGDS